MLKSRSSADSNLITYRPDIDGLRAIAVLSVIGFHLSRKMLPGGYLGVDIFFVLSGYLITSIIWREILTGNFSIIRFYDRRIRRIMPALLTLIFIVAVVSIMLLLPIDLIGFAKSLLATLGFVANIYFWRDTDYFSRNAEEKPLLHLWSLGVEEQFYILFPLILLLTANKTKKLTLIIVAVLCIGSLLLNILALKMIADMPAFYLLPTRSWELGLGALIALTPSRIKPIPGIMALLGSIGLALIIISVILGWRLNFPFIPESLLTVIGTSLIIYSGVQKENLVGRVLSFRVLVFIGLISYSLYLWHWPIIVFVRYYLVRDLTSFEMFGVSAIMLMLATLSWYYIERPFRSSRMIIEKVRLYTLTGVIIAALIAGVILVKSGLPERLNPDAARINAAVGTNYRCAVSDYLYFDNIRACSMELPSRNPEDADIVLMGNSHAGMYAPVFRDIVHNLSLNGLLIPVNGCLPIYGANISPECIDVGNRIIEGVIKLKRAKVVVIGLTWDSMIKRSGNTADTMVEELDKTINRLILAGKRVVLIGPIAIPNWDVASVTSRNLAFGRITKMQLYTDKRLFLSTYAKKIYHFERTNGAVFVRPDTVQCISGMCEYIINGYSLFADDNHVAAAQSFLFRPIFEKALKQALSASLNK
ncbi:MAG: acyltransferase [Spirochaetia bacterium]|nr:acyltransferase [Spirochaetia bacterium]